MWQKPQDIIDQSSGHLRWAWCSFFCNTWDEVAYIIISKIKLPSTETKQKSFFFHHCLKRLGIGQDVRQIHFTQLNLSLNSAEAGCTELTFPKVSPVKTDLVEETNTKPAAETQHGGDTQSRAMLFHRKSGRIGIQAGSKGS